MSPPSPAVTEAGPEQWVPDGFAVSQDSPETARRDPRQPGPDASGPESDAGDRKRSHDERHAIETLQRKLKASQQAIDELVANQARLEAMIESAGAAGRKGLADTSAAHASEIQELEERTKRQNAELHALVERLRETVDQAQRRQTQRIDAVSARSEDLEAGLRPAVSEIGATLAKAEAARADERDELEGRTKRQHDEFRASINQLRESATQELRRNEEVTAAELLRIREQTSREQASLTGSLGAMLSRIETLETQLVEVDRRARMGDELAKALNRYKGQHESVPETDDDGRADLNAASFEDLRALGLSVTQAARLVAHRDARGGFASADEVAGLPGIPDEQLAALLERVRI